MGLPTRDLTVLLVVAVIALVSFHWEAAFEFRTLEPLSIQTTSANAEFKNVYASLLNPFEPIVVDNLLAKQKEVILAFDRSIAVYRFRKQDEAMVEQTRHDFKSQPILMTYIGSQYGSTNSKWEQHRSVVLVLTADDYNVHCLSYPSLQNLWTTRVPGMAKHVRKFEGVTLADHAMVADYTGLYKGDLGAVFLTLRFASTMDVGQTQGTDEGNVNNNEVKVSDGLAQDTEDSELNKDEKLALEYITHESFFAFDLTSGKLRWKYTSRDEYSRQALHEADVESFNDDDQEEMSETAHDYKRHVAERAQHFEEADWRLWKQDIIEQALPHQWFTTRHTSLTPVRFEPEAQKARIFVDRKVVDALFGSASGSSFEDPYKYMSNNNQQYYEARSSNNVLLFENEEGITVIHLFTGKVLTRLPLPPYRTYADANGDTTINSIAVDAESGLVRMSTMYEEMRTLNQSQIYTAKLPGHVSSLTRLLHHDAPRTMTEFVAPLLLPASTRFTAPGAGFKGPVGKTLAQILPDLDKSVIPEKAYFVILLSSQGMMYCMRSDTGEVQWATDTEAGWAGMQALRAAMRRQPNRLRTQNQRGKGHFNDLEAQSTIDTKLSAVLMPYAMDAKQSNPTGVLAVTPAGLVLVGPDGGLLAREVTNLPTVSKTTLPVVADITNDGRNDILLVTHRAYHFYILSSGKSHVYPLLVLCFLILLIIVMVLKIAEARKSKAAIIEERYIEASTFAKAH